MKKFWKQLLCEHYWVDPEQPVLRMCSYIPHNSYSNFRLFIEAGVPDWAFWEAGDSRRNKRIWVCTACLKWRIEKSGWFPINPFPNHPSQEWIKNETRLMNQTLGERELEKMYPNRSHRQHLREP